SKAWFEAARTIGDIDIVGVVDLAKERAAARIAEFGLGAAIASDSLSAVLAKTSPDLLFDVVVPAARHATVAAGRDAGCHVLAEKPMAET
ncbi:Gfo/Idh/MocA family oxidoreductase, partial [Mycobacterium tuberculosis]|nr:Gfo/Idh/MocA family oxidoreductase [Mycobacterium tuberculosis]